MASQDTDAYLHSAQEFLLRQDRTADNETEYALQRWAYGQSLHKHDTFLVQIGQRPETALWGIVEIETGGPFYSIKPRIACRIPLYEGNREYEYVVKGVPWMSRSNRAKIAQTSSSFRPDKLSANQAFCAIGIEFGGTYGPLQASTSGGGQGDLMLFISDAQWSVFPPSFTKAFQAVQGPKHELEKKNLYVASALFGATAMEQYMPFSFTPVDRHLMIMDAPPADIT